MKLAQERWRSRRPEGEMSTIGLDVARGGSDATVLSPRFGSYFAEQIIVPGKGTPDGGSVAALVLQHPGTARL